jgi:hypothetical protein
MACPDDSDSESAKVRLSLSPRTERSPNPLVRTPRDKSLFFPKRRPRDYSGGRGAGQLISSRSSTMRPPPASGFPVSPGLRGSVVTAWKRGQTRTRRPVRFPRPSRGWVRPLAPLIPAHESPVNTQQVSQAKRTARALGRRPA